MDEKQGNHKDAPKVEQTVIEERLDQIVGLLEKIIERSDDIAKDLSRIREKLDELSFNEDYI